METHVYLHSEFVVGNGVKVPLLEGQIAATIPGKALTGVVDRPHDATPRTLIYIEPLDVAEKAALDAVVASHDGATPLLVGANLIASLSLDGPNADGSFSLTNLSAATLGGVVTQPQFFAPPAELIARITCSVKVNGKLSMHLCEAFPGDPPTEKSLHTAPHEVDDTGGVFQLQSFDSDIPPTGPLAEFRVDAWVDNVLTVAEVRYLAVSLFHLQFV